MAVIIDAINQQMDYSIYENQSVAAKFQLASKCDLLKKIAIVIAIATPVFAFFLPNVYAVISCLTLGVIGYDVFNIADNLGDAAKHSAEGTPPPSVRSNIAILLDGTILAGAIYRRLQHEDRRDAPRFPEEMGTFNEFHEQEINAQTEPLANS